MTARMTNRIQDSVVVAKYSKTGLCFDSGCGLASSCRTSASRPTSLPGAVGVCLKRKTSKQTSSPPSASHVSTRVATFRFGGLRAARASHWYSNCRPRCHRTWGSKQPMRMYVSSTNTKHTTRAWAGLTWPFWQCVMITRVDFLLWKYAPSKFNDIIDLGACGDGSSSSPLPCSIGKLGHRHEE
jgi:hypothetical protein